VVGQPWPHRVLHAAPQSAARAVRLAAALAGLAALTAYLYVALSRLGYPFPVEWLESNSLVEVHRILAGQPLYPAPTVEYVPDGYPPLYFAVSAAAARVLGVSYLTLRLVSLVSSLSCFALLARLVQRETGSVAAGFGAAGLFAAAYSVTDTWFDVGRVDSLFLALSIGGLYAARWMRGTRGAVAAGVLLAAAALTKQTGLAEGAAVVAALVPAPPPSASSTAPPRRTARERAGAAVAVPARRRGSVRVRNGDLEHPDVVQVPRFLLPAALLRRLGIHGGFRRPRGTQAAGHDQGAAPANQTRAASCAGTVPETPGGSRRRDR
jgi:hypothetical protein